MTDAEIRAVEQVAVSPAFLLAGTLTAAAVMLTTRRRARSCSPGTAPPFVLIVAISGLARHGALYAATTVLGYLVD